MAHRVDRVRPRIERAPSAEVELAALNERQAMRLLEPLQPDDPPRRLSAAGVVVIGCLVLGAFVVALAFVAQSLGVL